MNLLAFDSGPDLSRLLIVAIILYSILQIAVPFMIWGCLRHLRDIRDDIGTILRGENPQFLSTLQARIDRADEGGRRYTVEETRQSLGKGIDYEKLGKTLKKFL
jgi:hypothetical protein